MDIIKSTTSEEQIKIVSSYIQSFVDLNNQILFCRYAAMYLVLLFFHFPTFKCFFFSMTAFMTWHFFFFVHIITAWLLSQISISLNFQHLMHNASIRHREKALSLTMTMVSLDKKQHTSVHADGVLSLMPEFKHFTSFLNNLFFHSAYFILLLHFWYML